MNPPPSPVIFLEPSGIRIPAGLSNLEAFRHWARSDDFPESARIDWVGGCMEIDMTPEDLNTHGSPKSAIAGALIQNIQETDRGLVFIDRVRISCPEADLSAEPDVLVLLTESVASGRVELVPKADAEEGRFVEIQGPADLVVECVSDSSVAKDRRRLRERYHLAGVPEYWIVDARKNETDFELLLRNETGYRRSPPDSEGFARSEILARDVRLIRRRTIATLDFYQLELR